MRDLLESGLFTRAAIAASRQARELAISYLGQEGFLAGGSIGIVDIGWRGRLQRDLQRLVQEYKRLRNALLHGFHAGLVSKPIEIDFSNLHSYWETCAPAGEPLTGENLALFEGFTAGTHDGVLGDQRLSCGKVEPVLGSACNVSGDRWGVRLLQRSVLRFAVEFSLRFGRQEVDHADMMQVLLPLYRAFYDDPTETEARCWGRMTLSEGQVERTFIRLVPNWGWPRLIASLLPWGPRPRYWWRAASFAKAGSGMLIPAAGLNFIRFTAGRQ